MAAAALLLPTVAIGLFLGSGQMQLALGAALLLSVNLSAQVVMLFQGIRPRAFFEMKKARRAVWINGFIWPALHARGAA